MARERGENLLVDQFEEAVRAHAFRGAQMPEDHDALDARYELTKLKLLTAIEQLKGKKDGKEAKTEKASDGNAETE